MNFKTGSFSPRSDELTEGTQSTPSDTRRELSSRSGSGTDAARDGQSRTQSSMSSMASAAGVGSKIAEEDSDWRHCRVRYRERETGVDNTELGSAVDAPKGEKDRLAGGGVRIA